MFILNKKKKNTLFRVKMFINMISDFSLNKTYSYSHISKGIKSTSLPWKIDSSSLNKPKQKMNCLQPSALIRYNRYKMVSHA